MMFIGLIQAIENFTVGYRSYCSTIGDMLEIVPFKENMVVVSGRTNSIPFFSNHPGYFQNNAFPGSCWPHYVPFY